VESKVPQSDPNVPLPLMRPYFDQEELDEIKGVLDSGWVSQGPKVREFEERVCDYTGAKHAIALANCTTALHISLLALGVKKGDEVIVSDYTFPATGHAVMYCGAKPVFADVRMDTYNIDPELMKKNITKRTRAVIPVHAFGLPCDMDALNEVAEERGIKVVEDAACAFGAKWRGRQAGTMGDVGCYSFHARKGLTTGEGGMVVTDDAKLAERMRGYSVFGMTTAWEREKGRRFQIPKFMYLGFNYKLSDIAAAVGVVQLRRLDKVLRRKRALARYWSEKLEGMPGIAPPTENRGAFHVYQSYVAVLDKGLKRDRLIERLKLMGVQAQIGTYASHVQPVYHSRDRCPNSLELFKRAIALPHYYTMSESDIDKAAARLREAMRGLK
jgi:perosamine synthetase